MKTVILCGGKGTRLAEETVVRPKPMVEIGGKPILWHIMNIYAKHGFEDFVLALGYKAEFIKEYFLNFYAFSSDCRVNLANGSVEYLGGTPKNWTVSLHDTGSETLTGGRIHRLEKVLGRKESFMVTYGDGVANVDIQALVKFHKSHGKAATVTAVRPPARFGEMFLEGDRVSRFEEKPQVSSSWINGGFFVFEPKIFDYLNGDETILEREPLERLVRDQQLMVYRHSDFWQCMDTTRDRDLLQGLWNSGNPPWA